MAKIYPEEAFFIVPGKSSMPVWKQKELAYDPDFKDLHEQIEGGTKETWSSKHGYAITFKQEAAILKANTRKARIVEVHPSKKTETIPDPKKSCCVII